MFQMIFETEKKYHKNIFKFYNIKNIKNINLHPKF